MKGFESLHLKNFLNCFLYMFDHNYFLETQGAQNTEAMLTQVLE